MADINKKVRIRAGHRSHARKIISTANDVIEQIDGGEMGLLRKLKSLESELKDKLEQLKGMDREIVELIDDEKAIDQEVEASCEFVSVLYNCISDVQSTIATFATPPVKQGSSETTSSGSTTPLSGMGPKPNAIHARLPKLELKKFGGNPIEWTPFWDSFQSAVHVNENLNAVDKFNYLKSLLYGQAAETISGFSLTTENYGEAVNLLKERYGNKQVLISSHVESLLKLPPASTISDTKKLRAIYDKTESNIRSLKNIGIASETYGSFLAPVIMAKIPEELRIAITRELPSNDWTLEPILEIFRKELQLREKCQHIPGQSTTNKDSRNKGNHGSPYTAHSLLTGLANDNQQGPWCTYCRGNHTSASCTVVTQISARKQILRKKGKCFVCLRTGHVAVNCRKPVKECRRCNLIHHVSICESPNNPGSGNQEQQKENKEASSREASNSATPERNHEATSMLIDSKNSILLQTARTRVSNPGNDARSRNARIIFDSCSQRSYITERLKQALQLPVAGQDTLLIKTFGETSPKLQRCGVVQVAVKTIDEMEIYVSAYVVPTICAPISNQSVEFTQENYPHLRGLELADNTSETGDLAVDVLIGADFYWHFATGEVIRSDPAGPVAVSTKLGYVLSGPVQHPACNRQASTVNLTETHVLKISSAVVEERSLDSRVKQFWELDSLGILPNEEPVYQRFLDNIKFNGERYEVSLPFKEDHDVLPDNYQVSKSRLLHLLRRLKLKPEILEQYSEVIEEQLRNNVIEVVKEESVPEFGQVHYLPHHEVVRLDKSTTKVRVVFDASCKGSGPSLNDCLYAGPPLTPLIFDVLLRFRAHKIALTADIEKAFLNVAVAENHRDFLRFIWVDDIHSNNPQLVIRRFARVVFGVNSSPFLLNATIRHHMNSYRTIDPNFVDEVLRSLYVDDLASSRPGRDSAYEFYQKLNARFKEGGFNMRKWNTNDRQLLMRINSQCSSETSKQQATIQPEDQSFSQSQLPSTTSLQDCPKVLGISWDIEKDKLVFSFESLTSYLEENVVTKRVILSTIARIFDPLGVLSPIFILLKILFQVVCKKNVDWNVPVDRDVHEQWRSILENMRNASVISIDRWYLSKLKTNLNESCIELHGFGDASGKAYGAVIYLRAEYDGSVVCMLLAARARIAPIAGCTIPRLELLSAVVLARLMSNVRKVLCETLAITRCICWLDSEIALWWITQQRKEFKTFVQNRVVEIRKLLPPESWRHVPSESNPADLASRGCSADHLKSETQWWEGPSFLKEAEEFWPAKKQFGEAKYEDCELKRAKGVTINVAQTARVGIDQVVYVDRYSDLYKLLRVTSYVLRFIDAIRRRRSGRKRECIEPDAEEINRAEILWIKNCQDYVREDTGYQQLRVSLRLSEDRNGVLRCHGRIGNAPLPYETKFPAILAKDNAFTKLVIQACHSKVMHNGAKDTLTEVRSRFWITQGRQAVNKVISKCVTCKKLEGLRYNSAVPPDLPEFRVSDEPAFSCIGVDFAGPVYVRDIYSTNRKLNKAYIALYTCASTRALHLELVPDLSTVSFVKSFKRFIGRRGIPMLVVSDNAKTFKGSNLKAFLSKNNISWKFNIPLAPWWGGFFERLVRSVKRCLKKTLGHSKVTYEEFETLLVEVEGILNSRPLTYVSEEFAQPLTPSSLCIGRRLLSPVAEIKVRVPSGSAADLTRRQRHLNLMLDHFWDRWRREYLTELREHHREKGKLETRKINQGDVVCVHENSTPRQNWKVGLVRKLICGRDGRVRAAIIRLSRDDECVELSRPIEKLYPIEVQKDSLIDNVGNRESVPAIKFVADQQVGTVKSS